MISFPSSLELAQPSFIQFKYETHNGYSKIFLCGECLILEKDDAHSESREAFCPALFKLSLAN